ncbi:DUF72 domain-containing protein [bacterium]|nr:DUF72 domain-containing protein [bacterium]
MKKRSLYIGTSGWNYSHWKDVFYPEILPQKKWLEFYAETFQSVEINNSFYVLPSEKSVRTWHNKSPKSFLFSVKASRYITHMKKLKDPEEPVRHFLDRMKVLDEKLGPVLFQLPPKWKCNPERLASFLDQLPEGFRYTFEFREASWWNDQVSDLLKKKNAAFCIYELAGLQSPKWVMADFVYIRLHGPGSAYEGLYDNRTLAGWAGAISTWMRQGKTVFCYFDNDEAGYAVQNAQTLNDMLEDKK